MQDIFKISKTVAIVFRYNPSLIIDKLHLFCKSIHLSILSLVLLSKNVLYASLSLLFLSLLTSLFANTIHYTIGYYDKKYLIFINQLRFNYLIFVLLQKALEDKKSIIAVRLILFNTGFLILPHLLFMI